MARFRIEQYEVHTQTYEVDADSPGEAIVKVFNGVADTVDNTLKYIEVDEERGMPLHNLSREDVDYINDAGYSVDGYVNSVRSVCEAD